MDIKRGCYPFDSAQAKGGNILCSPKDFHKEAILLEIIENLLRKELWARPVPSNSISNLNPRPKPVILLHSLSTVVLLSRMG